MQRQQLRGITNFHSRFLSTAQFAITQIGPGLVGCSEQRVHLLQNVPVGTHVITLLNQTNGRVNPFLEETFELALKGRSQITGFTAVTNRHEVFPKCFHFPFIVTDQIGMQTGRMVMRLNKLSAGLMLNAEQQL